MADTFDIPVTYKCQELYFTASLITTGYTYKIQVNIFDKLVSFEPDEERNFRAVMGSEDLPDSGKIDKELLKEIAEAIESIVK